MRAILVDVGAAQALDGLLVAVDGVAIDVIGTWYDLPPEEGAEPVARPGYYANVRSDQPINWPAEVVEPTPDTPWRTWA
ncbi:hypothetical protein [Pseudomonas delhiensis]|uniref:hypothetical protein n=1 Tax=Pseudomonas delhiensis TaxID=366289 RepID=UPI00315A7D4F